MHLVIDIGNTQAKWAYFKDSELLESHECLSQDLVSALRARNGLSKIKSSIVSSSGAELPELSEFLSQFDFVLDFRPGVPVPLAIMYDTPSTLGADRLANAVAASILFPNRSCLIIDAGTCITYDLVSDKGEYLGGAISPGLHMRLKAMHQFTANLPLVEFNSSVKSIGTNTTNSLQSGAFYGFNHEINGMIQEYQKIMPELQVLITGGDCLHFDADSKCAIFADSNLTLAGLNEILLYNEK